MDTPGVRTGRVEKTDAFRRRRVADVVDSHADARQSGLVRLVGDQQQVTKQRQRVRAQVRIRQIGLQYDLRVGQVAHVHSGEVFGSAFMRDPKDALTVRELLKSDAFAAVAKSIQVMMGNQLHVFDFLIVRCHWASSHKEKPFHSFQSFQTFQAFKLSKSEYRNPKQCEADKTKNSKSETGPFRIFCFFEHSNL